MQRLTIIILSCVLFSFPLCAHSETFAGKFEKIRLQFATLASLARYISEARKNLSAVPYYGSASTNRYVAEQIYKRLKAINNNEHV